MLDLHCHILPSIDDGAQDLDTSLAMLKIAVESGTVGIVATPHAIEGKWLPTWHEILEGCARLSAAGQTMGLTIPIYPGAEVFVHMDILDQIKGPGPYCINGSRYMLVELPAREIPRFTEEFFFTLQARGITPILAHPERHPEIAKHPEILKGWIGKGILVQINASSITGRMGERAMKTAEYLLKSNMVHCIGSDAHGVRTRKPDLRKAAEKIKLLVGEAKVQELLVTNSTKVIQNEDVDVPEVELQHFHGKASLLKTLLGGFWK